MASIRGKKQKQRNRNQNTSTLKFPEHRNHYCFFFLLHDKSFGDEPELKPEDEV